MKTTLIMGALLLLIFSCGPGFDLSKDINCKAEITIPSERDEPVIVNVRLFDCE